jgi:hypothetical protein
MLLKSGLTLNCRNIPPKIPLNNKICLYSNEIGELYTIDFNGVIKPVLNPYNNPTSPNPEPIYLNWLDNIGTTIDSSLGNVYRLTIAGNLGTINHINIPSGYYEFTLFINWQSGIVITPPSWVNGLAFPDNLGNYIIKGCSINPNEVIITQVIPY